MERGDEDLKYLYTVGEGQDGTRLDAFLAGELRDHSRSYIKKLCKEGRARINDKRGKAGQKLKMDDEVSFLIPPARELAISAEEMDLSIVYEDDDLIVIDKPKGMVVHPCPGRYSGTLVNGLLAHCRDQLSAINGVLRPGIVHRIDKDTTGLLLVCKNDMAHRDLALQLKDHSITRKYEAIVWNNFTEESGVVSQPIARSRKDRIRMAVDVNHGKKAVTHYQVINHLNRKFNHIECRLETGRTHQIRVHMAFIGHPLLGDQVYGPKKTVPGLPAMTGQCLHAGLLGFKHPSTGQYMEFSSPPPAYFQDILFALQK